ncbi:carboxypeptidase-like regulatory domain-containing protein [Botrimarina hoheduenensis]|uniref:Carboxypeptidase regulatory-like domain-containing protein n=1 Tax=Botrimarina hoheduenensis TaxID=2528000 RepID=A0A5C5WDL0_9BACT|nr:carboxypeptidase-like regulatory domain-containing protein [Botrimarina hoheduenensis]TWT48587.1 hypothetical protein Pla111_03620 [Botrimarina hoheduenensis]
MPNRPVPGRNHGATLIAGCALLVGCADRNTAYVSGLITVSGKPVSDAAVMFFAESGGRPFVANSDADGRYHMVINRPAMKDRETYRVAIAAVERESAGSSETDSPVAELLAEAAPQTRPPSWRTPPRYADIQTSDLTLTVERASQNTGDFDLCE